MAYANDQVALHGSEIFEKIYAEAYSRELQAAKAEYARRFPRT
jgi:hypothetical protein